MRRGGRTGGAVPVVCEKGHRLVLIVFYFRGTGLRVFPVELREGVFFVRWILLGGGEGSCLYERVGG